MMQVLEGRIAAIEHPSVPQATKDAWISEIRAVREPYQTAVEPLRAAEALRTVTDKALTDVVRGMAVALSKLKREYVNLGLTETQIHEIIPDARRSGTREQPGEPTEPTPA